MGARTLAVFAVVGTGIFLCMCRLAAVKLQLGGTLDVGKLAVCGCMEIANAEIKAFCVHLDPDLTIRKMARTEKQFGEDVAATVLSYMATLAFFPRAQQQAMMFGSMIGMLSISMSPVLCCVSTLFTPLLWALSLTVVAISVVQADATLHQEIVTALAIAWAIVIGLCLFSRSPAQQLPERPPVAHKGTHSMTAQRLRPRAAAEKEFSAHALHQTYADQDEEEDADYINRRFSQNIKLQQQQRSRNRRAETPPPRNLRAQAVVERDFSAPTHYQTPVDQDAEEDIDEGIRQLQQRIDEGIRQLQQHIRRRRPQTPPPRKQAVVKKGAPTTSYVHTHNE